MIQNVLNSPTLKTAGPVNPALAVPVGRGFRASPLNYGPSPQLPTRGFIANAGGLEVVGRGLQNIGGAISAYQAKEAEAINAKRIADAEVIMDQARIDMAVEAAKNQNDPDGWEDMAQKRASEVQKLILTKDLPPNTRRELEIRSLKWATRAVGEMKLAKINRNVELAGQSLTAAHARAVQAGEFDRLPEIRSEAAKFLSPGAVQRMEVEELDRKRDIIDMRADTLAKNGGTAAVPAITALYDEHAELFPDGEKENRLAGKQYEAEKQDLLVLSNDNPKVAVELARRKLRAPDAIVIERQAQERMRELRVGSISNWKEAISTGRIPSEKELKEDDNLTDADRMGIIGLALEGAKNDTVAFQRVETAIDAYRPTEGDALARANFESMLETNFSGPHLDTLKKKWTEKTTSAPDFVETAEAFAALDKWAFEDQKFGPYKMPVEGEDGKPLMKKKEGLYRLEKGWFWGESYEQGEATFEPVMKDDPAARDKVAAQVSAIKETIKREKAEGKFLDSRAVFNRMAELARMPLTSAAASEASSVAPSMDSMPPINSLNGAPPPVSLFPSIDAILDQPHATHP